VSFKWNSTGTAVLVFASCDVDKTNQSYYGETNLHFLRVRRPSAPARLLRVPRAGEFFSLQKRASPPSNQP
jgi:uncharacterized protein with WD repeat